MNFVWSSRWFTIHLHELDDGWPESVGEQGLLLLVLTHYIHYIAKQYIKDVLKAEETSSIKTIYYKYKTLVCIVSFVFSHTEPFTHRRFCTQAVTRRSFYIQRLLRTDTFTQRRLYTQTLLHADTFTRKHFYIQTLLHKDTFTHRHIYTQTLLHKDSFTHRRFYTQKLLHTEGYSHRH